ncbi:hypothetical protein [Inquilinus sp. CAU 1745]|uniref:hypothetical protein n=1 Tax=Inquilinus sp. CAU 1745 TaxID=3140369 RepID=UPI00325AFC61
MTQQERPAAAAVLEQLNRIVSSGEFDASERNRRFLRYIVTETLDGRADRIKAYGIATAVFERDSGFDPQTDPIIRIEAGRLRRALAHYYLTAGQSDPIRITVPKGSYVPNFACMPDAPVVPAQAERTRHGGRRIRPWMAVAPVLLVLLTLGASWAGGFRPFGENVERQTPVERGPRIFIAPFEADSATTDHAGLASGVTRDIVAGLTRFEEMFILAPETSLRHGAREDLVALVRDLDVDYIVSGGLSATPERMRVTVALVDARSRQFLWSEAFEGDLSAGDPLRAQMQVADRVVRALAQPCGVIFNVRVRDIRGAPPGSLTSHECVLEYYRHYQGARAGYRAVTATPAPTPALPRFAGEGVP